MGVSKLYHFAIRCDYIIAFCSSIFHGEWEWGFGLDHIAIHIHCTLPFAVLLLFRIARDGTILKLSSIAFPVLFFGNRYEALGLSFCHS